MATPSVKDVCLLCVSASGIKSDGLNGRVLRSRSGTVFKWKFESLRKLGGKCEHLELVWGE